MTTGALAFALLAWWFGTGAILYLHRLPTRTHASSGVGLTGLAGLAFVGLILSARSSSVGAAYLAFASALVVWAWHELVFLFGWLTGPRKLPCPEGIREARRFRFATEVVLHHELALAATALLIVGLTWSGPNQVGTWTFAVLWLMRISAKLNVYLGVRNLTEEFIPKHLQYMKSYFRVRRRLNHLMPLSVGLALSGLGWLVWRYHGPSVTEAERVGAMLVGTLLALAALEHLFLVLPVPDKRLWMWAMRAADRQS